jgi:chitin synthase
LPLSVPGTFYTALNALKPFLHTATPFNPSLPRYSALSASFSLNLTGEITGAALSLSSSGIDTNGGLLNVPAEQGYRAFDVFYYLLTSASTTEREFLDLKAPQKYTLLRKSSTYDPPSYLPAADDAAAAEDFRDSLKAIGIKGASLRHLLSVVAALLRLGDGIGFLVDEEELESTCEDVAGLLDFDPEVLLKKCATEEREVLLAAIYEALVDWVIVKANEAIKFEMQSGRALGSSSGSDVGVATPPSSHEDGDNVSVTVIEVPNSELGKALSLKTIFDDSNGINAEMNEDGVPSIPAGSSVIREMTQAIANNAGDLDIVDSPSYRARENDIDRREGALEKIGADLEPDNFLRRLLYPVDGSGITLGKAGRFSLTNVLASSRAWFQLCLHPSDDLPAALANRSPQNLSWSAGSVSGQIRTWRLPEWANHRNKQLDFTADFDIDEFVDRYSRLGCQAGRDGVESWIMERGWSNGEVVIGTERVWIRESAWWDAECMLDMQTNDGVGGGMMGPGPMESSYSLQTPAVMNGIENPFFGGSQYGESRDNLVSRQPSLAPSRLGAKSLAPTKMTAGGDYGLGFKGDDKHQDVTYYGELDPDLTDGKVVHEEPVEFTRRLWVAFAWGLTFWIPSFVLHHVGRMKRPDVRLAWREKIALVFLIGLMNAIVIFYIVFFGKLLCPNSDKAWNQGQVATHQGDTDWYVSWRGGVYDMTKFWKLQHSDTSVETTNDMMSPFAGANVDNIFPVPLDQACRGLGISSSVVLTPNTTAENPSAIHALGDAQSDPDTKLKDPSWYSETLIPKMKEYYKGDLVVKKGVVKSEGTNQAHNWFILEGVIYDLTDYFATLKTMNGYPGYDFIPADVTDLIKENPGLDITKDFNALKNVTMRENSRNCFKNAFKAGIPDFRDSAKCQVNNYILLAFTIIVCTVIVVKFLAALQLGSKSRPAQQDKFVICQVPAYTEGEDSLRKGLDSLTALAYDNKRKLICVICDGMIVGGGNDRPTPKIVLDVLGVDPKIDPPALPFKSVGNGSEQLNYGKVYSGLYEFEGNVVPYLVVVKVGKESEQSKSKPGNRGKRDSQVLLMNFLNRVHHRSAMSPLELEMFHQINNIIGVDPELYEYLFQVDADTKVKEDSLNRLVAACAHDAKIAGICGETSLENEDHSWWTMMQVYEYYISHNLAKAFESLFASVTCLPGW